MGMYDQFKTDGNLETQGIVLDYGDFRVTVARAGGANKRFERTLEAKTKAYKRAIQTETLPNEKGKAILREVFAEAVVLNWEVRKPGKKEGEDTWEVGIEGPSGDVLPFSADNVAATFKALPDLFADIQEQAGKVSLFRAAVLEAEAGN
jgi:hypothetical protein